MASNNLIPSWIASLVERCLGFYIDQTSGSRIEVEDNGACLSFRISQPSCLALISEWGIGPTGDGAVLIDANNQIPGTIPNESLIVSNPVSSASKSPQKRCIELLDFTLVVTYSDPSPDIRLCVNRCRIDWQGKEHSFTPKKKLKKNNTIKKLLDKVLQRVRDSQKTRQLAADDTPSAKPLQSEVEASIHQSSPENNNGSQIFSQVTASQHDPLEGNSKAKSFLQTGSSLLRRLIPFSATSVGGISSPNQPPDSPKGLAAPGKTTQEIFDHTTSKSTRRASIESQTGNDHFGDIPRINPPDLNSEELETSPRRKQQKDVPSKKIDQPAELVSESNAVDKIENHTASRPSPRKRRRRSPSNVPVSNLSNNEVEQSIDGHPSPKRQKTHTAQDNPTEPSHAEPSTANATGATNQRDESLNAPIDPSPAAKSSRVNPWKWRGDIPPHEIHIEKEQKELLESHRIRWIPSAVGDLPVQGHVPPSLLRQWNIIVERRNQSVEMDNASPARSVTPRRDSSSSSESEEDQIPWSASPSPNGRALRRLPADSSPLKGRTPERRQRSSDEVEKEVNQVEYNQRSTIANHTSQSEVAGNDATQPSREISAFGSSTKVGDDDSGREAGIASTQDARSELGGENKKGPQRVSEGVTAASNPAQHPTAEEGTSPPAAVNSPEASAEHLHAHDSGDESDDSMMDTSLPIALGGSFPEPSLDTPHEQEPTSSGHSLPSANAGCVQVFETPAINNSRLPPVQATKEPGSPNVTDETSSSNQQTKSSSQFRALNTYPVHGNHEQTQSSNGEPRSSISSKGSVQVKRTQLQPNNQNQSAHEGTQTQSQSEVVLDSSGPAQRHQDIPQSESKSTTESLPHQTTASRHPEESQPMQPTQDSMAGLSSLGPSMGSQISPLARFMPAANDDSSPSKAPREPSTGPTDSSQSSLLTQSAELITRRLGYINNPVQFVEAHGVYERFRTQYLPHYTGDFAHFVELCSKLQATRSGGQLQRSFLWDDFIIMHLTQFPLYFERYSSQETNPLNYEEYFLLHHSQPIHKKRCLTLPAIDIAASQAFPAEMVSQVISDHQSPPPDPPATQNENLGQSFTASLVNQFSKFNAHSFSDISPSGLPPVDIGARFMEQPSREPSVDIKMEHSEEPSEWVDTQALPLSSYENTGAPTIVKHDPDAENHLSLGSCIANTQETTDVVMDDAKEIPSVEENEETEEMEYYEKEEEKSDNDEVDHDEESDFDGPRHETASVELGDETFTSKPEASTNGHADADTTSEAESDEENWFLALQRSRIPVPNWSDDPDTPFKRWAEADQNILSERRRRGGTKILLDAKGVIRRPIHR
ncbi:unnamed protein product [Penicillium pancosmium]